MGQTQLKSKQSLGQQWQAYSQTAQGQYIRSMNPYSSRIYQNIYTKQLIEEYELNFTSQHDYMNYVRQLEYRRDRMGERQMIGASQKMQKAGMKNCKYLYRIKQFLNVNEEDVCSNAWKGLLYIDRIDVRLTEIIDIPFQDELYLIESCLQGFKVLYQQVGYFDIIQDMIFITKKGEVKVWLHPNLAKNQPFYISKNLQLNNCSQSIMIINLLNIIENNSDKFSSKRMHFKEYLIKRNILERLSFYKALEEFKRFCNQCDLHIRTFLKSVYQLYYGIAPLPVDQSQVLNVEEFGQAGFMAGDRFGHMRYQSSFVRKKDRGHGFPTSVQTPHKKDLNFFNDSLSSRRSSVSSSNNQIKKNSLKKQKQQIIYINQFNCQGHVRKGSKHEQPQTPISNLNPNNRISWDKPQYNEYSFGKQHKDIPLLAGSLVADQKHTKMSMVAPQRINYVRKVQRQQRSNRMPTIASEEHSIRSQKINNVQNFKFMNSKASFSTYSLNPIQINAHNINKINYNPREIANPYNSNLKYFAVHQEYRLDTEIARDIQRTFGVNPYDL